MSWRIAADAREIFVDLVAVSPTGQLHFIRTLNKKDQILFGLSEALSLLPGEAKSAIESGLAKLWLSTDFERIAIREQWGSHAALVATEGFENLLDLSTQQRRRNFALQAEKLSPIISKDYSFGVTERTLVDGTVQKPLDQAEIDVLVSKLELSEVKNVGVCFLHSKKNPENEKKLAERLREKNFQVFCSFEENGTELKRAHAVSQKAFLASGQSELQEKLLQMGFKSENIFLKKDRAVHRQGSQKALFVEFVEDRITVTQNETTRELETSPFNVIEIDAGGLVHIGPYRIDSEPGPVTFGKGLMLTPFDLFCLKTKMTSNDISRLKFDSTKVGRQLGPLALSLRMDPETCADKCLALYQDLVAMEIEQTFALTPDLIVTGGWLAPTFGPALARRLGVRKIFIPSFSNWLTPLQLLEIDPSPKSVVSILGEISGTFPGALKEGEIHDV